MNRDIYNLVYVFVDTCEYYRQLSTNLSSYEVLDADGELVPFNVTFFDRAVRQGEGTSQMRASYVASVS